MSIGYADERTGVLADSLVVSKGFVTDAALVATGTLFVAVLAQVSVPLWPVPVTGQTLGVLIVGAALGARRGAAALVLYMVVGIVGLPVFANFTGGPLSVLKPSFGYVIGFIFAAWVVGWIAERQWDRKFWRSLAGYALASIIPFLFGVPYLAIVLGSLGVDNDIATVITLGVTPFLLGGLIKAVIAAGITPIAWRGVAALDSRKR